MFLILCACARVYMFTPDQANFYMYMYFIFYAHYLLVSRFTGVHFNIVCMNVHVLNVVSLVNSSFPQGRGLDVKRLRVFSTTLVK